MSGHTLKEHGGSNLGVQPVWHLDQDFGRDGCLLRVGTANSPVHDGITYAHAIYAITHRRYQPCRFKAWDGRQAWRRSSAASTGGNIGEVYADGLNVHQRQSRAGGGLGQSSYFSTSGPPNSCILVAFIFSSFLLMYSVWFTKPSSARKPVGLGGHFGGQSPAIPYPLPARPPNPTGSSCVVGASVNH